MVVRKQSRGDVTREALMRAAEKLIASKGLENITIREIVDAAGQKNESALQYHFQNLTGLVQAIHAKRDAQIHAMRSVEIEKLSRKTAEPTLRDVCELMIGPAFLLAKSKPDFRQYVKAFGHEIALTDQSALKIVRRQGGDTDHEINRLLRSVLPSLDDAAFERRFQLLAPRVRKTSLRCNIIFRTSRAWYERYIPFVMRRYMRCELLKSRSSAEKQLSQRCETFAS